MHHIEAVTLDFFQTLVRHRLGVGGRGRTLVEYLASQGLETRPWEHRMLYDIFEPHAREYSPQHSLARKQAYFVRVAERVFECLGVAEGIDEPARHATAIWELLGPASLEVYPDVIDSLSRLHRAGYGMAIVSNWQCGLAHFCTELGLGRFFEHVIASAEVGHEKPDRAIFDEAASRLGVAHDRILHVGDSPVDDWEGARAAGLHALLLDRLGDRDDSRGDVVHGLGSVSDRLGATAGQRAGGPAFG
jgi:HAD superfamily hydrolase (TIGR01549 family)